MGELEQQIKLVKEALSFSPNNVPLMKHLVQLLLQAGQEDEALDYLKKLVEETRDEEILLQVARLYYQRGELDEGEDFLNRVKPSPEKSLLLAKYAFSKNDFQHAYNLYEQAVEQNTELADPDFFEELQEHNIKRKARLRVYDTQSGTWDDIVEQPGLTFADVGGLDELKESIKLNIIYPFQHPELYRAYGKKLGGGILLYGPPGCGKTYIARATAGESHANFISISLTDVLDMYIGNSEKNLHEIFELARRKAPSVIFIDEIDALGASRQQINYHGRTLVNQLLSELDGIKSDNEGILLLGATNTPWYLDPALKRPGRFDRILFVPPPDLKARMEIFKIYLKEKPMVNIDFMKLAKKTEKYSGADIRGVCDYSSEIAFQSAMKTRKMVPITMDHLLEAIKKVKPSTIEWLSTAKNYATYSNETGMYDAILNYLK